MLALKEDSRMRWNSRWQRPTRLPRATTRLLGIVAACCALALAVGACSLTAPSSNGGTSSNTGSVSTGQGGTTSVQILRGGGGTAMVLVPITIDGHGPYNFALDTGAGITLIDTQLADELQLPVTGSSAQVSGVGGAQDITPVHIDGWNAGKITLPSADIGKTGLSSFRNNADVRGLLGSDILSRFGRVTINYNTAELSVSDTPAPQSYAAPADEPLAVRMRDTLRSAA